jgi:hypothetical protein
MMSCAYNDEKGDPVGVKSGEQWLIEEGEDDCRGYCVLKMDESIVKSHCAQRWRVVMCYKDIARRRCVA